MFNAWTAGALTTSIEPGEACLRIGRRGDAGLRPPSVSLPKDSRTSTKRQGLLALKQCLCSQPPTESGGRHAHLILAPQSPSAF